MLWAGAIRWQWTALLPVFYFGALGVGFVGYFLALGDASIFTDSSGVVRIGRLTCFSIAATVGGSILILLACLFLGFPLHL
jgi:hypothetical protein